MYLWSLLDRLWVLFPISSHKLQTQTLKRIFLRSEVEIKGQGSDDQTKMYQIFLF